GILSAAFKSTRPCSPQPIRPTFNVLVPPAAAQARDAAEDVTRTAAPSFTPAARKSRRERPAAVESGVGRGFGVFMRVGRLAASGRVQRQLGTDELSDPQAIQNSTRSNFRPCLAYLSAQTTQRLWRTRSRAPAIMPT